MKTKMVFNRCVSCDSLKIKLIKGIYVLKIKGKEIKIPEIEYYKCSHCGERFADSENNSKIDLFMKKKTKKTSQPSFEADSFSAC